MDIYQAPEQFSVQTSDIELNKKYITVDERIDPIVLPERCIFCNQPGQQHSRRLVWLPGVSYFFVLLFGVGLIISYMVYAKYRRVIFTICPHHERKRRRVLIWILLFLCLAVMCFLKEMLILFILCFWVFLYLTLTHLHFIRMAHVKEGKVWIGGTEKAFRKSLDSVQSPEEKNFD